MPSREADVSCVSALCALRGDRHQWFYIVKIKNYEDQTEQYFNEIFCTYVLNIIGYPRGLHRNPVPVPVPTESGPFSIPVPVPVPVPGKLIPEFYRIFPQIKL